MTKMFWGKIRSRFQWSWSSFYLSFFGTQKSIAKATTNKISQIFWLNQKSVNLLISVLDSVLLTKNKTICSTIKSRLCKWMNGSLVLFSKTFSFTKFKSDSMELSSFAPIIRGKTHFLFTDFKFVAFFNGNYHFYSFVFYSLRWNCMMWCSSCSHGVLAIIILTREK